MGVDSTLRKHPPYDAHHIHSDRHPTGLTQQQTWKPEIEDCWGEMSLSIALIWYRLTRKNVESQPSSLMLVHVMSVHWVDYSI